MLLQCRLGNLASGRSQPSQNMECSQPFGYDWAALELL